MCFCFVLSLDHNTFMSYSISNLIGKIPSELKTSALAFYFLKLHRICMTADQLRRL